MEQLLEAEVELGLTSEELEGFGIAYAGTMTA